MSLAKKITISVIAVLVVGLAALGVTVKVVLLHDRIVEGVTVKGVALGGLTKKEARNELRNLEDKIRSTTVKVVYWDKSWPLRLAEGGVTLDIGNMVEQAYNYGRQGWWWEQYTRRKELAREGAVIPLKVVVNDGMLSSKIKELAKRITVLPRNATFRITPEDKVEIIQESIGWGPDLDQVKEDIIRLVTGDGEPEVKLRLEEIKPEKTAEDVAGMGINGLVSQFVTRFDASQANRSYNIVVAAGALDGLLVKPGEVVSFNQIVGPRSTAAGYREAPVVVNNELVPGIGGGVCQVSTTLYNSLLVGNFEIVYRRPHSIPVGYVPIGRDATVTYGGIDFKFRNNRQSYMFIKSSVKGNLLTFKIFGNINEKLPVVIIDNINQIIEPKVSYEKDPNLDRGKEVVKEPGRKGYRTTTVRVVYQNGRVIKREVVTKSYYKPKNKIIAVGTRKPAAPVIPAPKPAVPPQVNPGPNPSVQPHPSPVPDPVSGGGSGPG